MCDSNAKMQNSMPDTAYLMLKIKFSCQIRWF